MHETILKSLRELRTQGYRISKKKNENATEDHENWADTTHEISGREI